MKMKCTGFNDSLNIGPETSKVSRIIPMSQLKQQEEQS